MESGEKNDELGNQNEYYDRIKKHRGSGKAIIATARKLLGIIYNTLKNDWVFEDFPNFVLADS
ncbi:MAG: hypothetical protein KAT56_08115 [Sedimentisphaerales bacterium]|nr:hypothetical protein [Sedimentisphaerales bacterium]